MSQVIQHVGAGANSGAYESDGDNDLTYGFLTGNSSQMLMETLNVQNTVQHSDSAQVIKMARRSVKLLYQFGEQGANNPYVAMGLNPYGIAWGFGLGSGVPLLLDQQSDGAVLLAFEGLCSRQENSGTAYETSLVFDAGNSSEMADDTMVDDPLPAGAVLTFTTPYSEANTTSYAVGSDMSGFSAKNQTNGYPSPGSVAFFDGAADETIMHLGPIKAMGKSTANTATVLTDTSKPTAFNAAGLGIAADDQILIFQSVGVDLAGSLAFTIASFTADTITHSGMSATNTVLSYFVFAKNYLFTLSAATDRTVTTTDTVDFTDATFEANMNTGDFVLFNVTTGMIVRIASDATSHPSWAAGTLCFLNNNINAGSQRVLNLGIRSGASTTDCAASDVVCILPLISLVGLYTDPSASSGGGGASPEFISGNFIS